MKMFLDLHSAPLEFSRTFPGSVRSRHAKRPLPPQPAAHQRGFSLIEVIVALAIIAVVLAVIAVSIRGRSRAQKVEATVNQVTDVYQAAIGWEMGRPGGFTGITCDELAGLGELAFLPNSVATCATADNWQGAITVAAGGSPDAVTITVANITDSQACQQIAQELGKVGGASVAATCSGTSVSAAYE